MPNYVSAGTEWYQLTAAEVTTLGLDVSQQSPSASVVATVLATVRAASRKSLKH